MSECVSRIFLTFSLSLLFYVLPVFSVDAYVKDVLRRDGHPVLQISRLPSPVESEDSQTQLEALDNHYTANNCFARATFVADHDALRFM